VSRLNVAEDRASYANNRSAADVYPRSNEHVTPDPDLVFYDDGSILVGKGHVPIIVRARAEVGTLRYDGVTAYGDSVKTIELDMIADP
jgi:hypothetical protein